MSETKTDNEAQDAKTNPSLSGVGSTAGSVEERVHNATDFAVINAAAKAWIEAGGDCDGFQYCWHHVRDRIGELE